MFNEAPRKPSFPTQEEEVLKFWNDEGIIEKSFKINKGKEKFVFYEGPPTANGMPHVGHVLTRVIKDVFLRYRSMRGYDVLRKAGWDTHGLPVEIQVEKELGLADKRDIEKYGVEKFIVKCRESVFKYEAEWRKMTRRVGFWCDLDNPYVTCENNYIESVWWILKQLNDRGLLYKGHKIVPHCPRCDTALSSHEVAQGYKDVDDPSVFVLCPLVEEPDTAILVWTTTPWTLLSNVALAVSEEFDYVKVRHGKGTIILAEGRVEAVFGENKPEVVGKFKGADLIGKKYEPFFTFCDLEGKSAHYVVGADFVTLTDGTGVVHIAPAFGEDDYRIGNAHNLPFLQPVGMDGKFTDVVEPWKGVFIKDADPDIIKNLQERGRLFRSETYNHSYPFCWRCKSPLIYYGRSSWFIKTTAVKQTLLDVNNSINWIPDHIKKGRMGDFLENNIDWAVSRDRYWGTPLNLWICDSDPSHILAVDSAADLKKHAIDYPDGDLDLHKPWVDEVHCKCDKCGGRMTRSPEVIDCWLDSGAMPYAQWHYPHENKELFDSLFPADFITEAVDQTRGWFYSLICLGSLLFEKSPFKNCIVMGHVLDGEGRKMSKSLGNVVEPSDAFEQFGADSFRWLFYRDNNPWIPTRFSEDSLRETQKNFFLGLWNVYSFFVIYANLDNFNPAEHKAKRNDLHVIDRWILSRLNHTALDVRTQLDNYQVMPAARAMEALLEDISNWYIRRCRARFWKSEKDADKWAAYSTLHEVLLKYVSLLAPFSPFVSETIFQNLSQGCGMAQSVHLEKYPEPDNDLMDPDLEEAMKSVRDVTNEGRMLRSKKMIKVRQPLQKIFVAVKDEELSGKIEPLIPLIMEELNVREVILVKNFANLQQITLKPNFKKLGPKLGSDVKTAQGYFNALPDHNELGGRYVKNGSLEIEIEGKMFKFEEGELDVEYSAADDVALGEFVALDMEITDELREAGMLRELVHLVQNMRKEQDLEYSARIKVEYAGAPEVEALFAKYGDFIKGETLAIELASGLELGAGEKLDVDGHELSLRISICGQKSFNM